MITTLLIAAIVLFAFWYQRKYYIDHWQEELDVNVKFQVPEIAEHGEGKLQIVVENRKKLPLSVLMVKFQTDKHLEFEKNKGSVTTDQFYHNDVFQVGGGERVTRTLHFYGKKRGYYRINNIDLSSSDLFMSCDLRSSFQPSECIYVLPRACESRDFQMLLQQLNGEMITKRNLYEDPFELRGIREYQPFDSMRSINWKATAKTGNFMVNQKNYTSPKTVRIFVNMEDHRLIKDYDQMENTIRLAAGLVKYLLEQGIKVAFYCNGLDALTNDPTLKAASKGMNHATAILRSMARLDTSKEPTNFNKLFYRRIFSEQENSHTCFLSTSLDKEFMELLCDYSRSGRVYSWFIPANKDLEVETIPPLIRGNFKQIRI